MAYITRSTTQLGTKPAPFMAAFSSKGPNTVVPGILKVFQASQSSSIFFLHLHLIIQNITTKSCTISSKPLLFVQPDITAPGVSVIAAYTEAQGPTNQDFDTRRVLFNSVSGTSMSCPHISGIVGLLKTLHPEWSPAAIKSAIMTTGENNLVIEKIRIYSRAFFFCRVCLLIDGRKCKLLTNLKH